MPEKRPKFTSSFVLSLSGGRFRGSRLTGLRPGREVFEGTINRSGRIMLQSVGSFDGDRKSGWKTQASGELNSAGETTLTGRLTGRNGFRECTVSFGPNEAVAASIGKTIVSPVAKADDKPSAIANNTLSLDRNMRATNQNTESIKQSLKATDDAKKAVAQLTAQVTKSTEVTKETATSINRRIGELGAQIKLLTSVLEQQQELQKSAQGSDRVSVEATVTVIDRRIAALKKDYGTQDRPFSAYLTSITPNDRDLYLTARKASENYPKVPYYIPGTSETGEFWVEPEVTDKGEMNFEFKFVDVGSPVEKVRSKIGMTLPEIESTQKAFLKLNEWSNVAHANKLRKAYQKRVICFPSAECPQDGETVENKSSTEVRFNVYEDGSTAGRIQRNKGRFVEGYNISIESALLLQAYLRYVIAEAKTEFKSGTQDKKALDLLFQ